IFLHDALPISKLWLYIAYITSNIWSLACIASPSFKTNSPRQSTVTVIPLLFKRSIVSTKSVIVFLATTFLAPNIGPISLAVLFIKRLLDNPIQTYFTIGILIPPILLIAMLSIIV